MTRATLIDHRLRSLSLLAFLASATGCFQVDEMLKPPAPEVVFFESCDGAPEPALPTQPITCDGPDLHGWSNGARPVNTQPCPASPQGNCTQVVLGRLPDTAKYINCPGYIVLNRSDWTINLNDSFIACAAACELGTCNPPVIVVSGRDAIPDFDEDYTLTTVTSRELCELHNSSCTVALADDNGPGFVDCMCTAGDP